LTLTKIFFWVLLVLFGNFGAKSSNHGAKYLMLLKQVLDFYFIFRVAALQFELLKSLHPTVHEHRGQYKKPRSLKRLIMLKTVSI